MSFREAPVRARRIFKENGLFARYSGNSLKNGVKSTYGRAKHNNPVL
jgi:hypothetical protein